MSRSRDQNTALLDGKFLSKAELKSRLLKMDIELDNKDQSKNHYRSLYNKLVTDFDRRMKIKSILETDIIDRPEKNLNRKRMRDGSEDTPEFTEVDAVNKKGKNVINGSKGRRAKNKTEEDMHVDEPVEDNMVNFEELNNRNLTMGNFMEKIEKDINDYRSNFKKIESGVSIGLSGNSGINSQIDANSLSFSKDYGFDNRRSFAVSTFAKSSGADEAISKANGNLGQNLQDTNFNPIMNPAVMKKLDYVEESGGRMSDSDSNSPPSEKSREIFSQVRFPSIQKVKISNISSGVKVNIGAPLIRESAHRFESEPQGGVKGSAASGRNSKTNSGIVAYVRKFDNVSNISPNASSHALRFNLNNGSKKSLPGSSKNIKEILNKVEVASNPISPRPMSMNNSLNPPKWDFHKSAANVPTMDRPEEYYQPCNRPQQRIKSAISSTRSIIVSIRNANLNGPEVQEILNQGSIPVVTEISRAFNYKDYSLLFLYTILAAGAIICIVLFFKHEGASAVQQFLENIDPNLQALIIGMIASTIGIFYFKKFNNTQYFQEIAAQDYENVKELIKNNYQTEENPLGLFESNFIRDFAKKHNLSEGKYRKNILPHLIRIKNSKVELEEKEVLIQEQAHIVWDLIDN